MSRAVRQLVPRPGVLPCFAQRKRHIYAQPPGVQHPPEDNEPSWLTHCYRGSKLLKRECNLCVEEWKERLQIDKPRYYYGDIVPQFNFREKKDRDKFFTVADGDFNRGYSKAEFVGTRQSTGLFRGYLDTRVPQDGETVKSGYVALQGRETNRSFFRKVYLEWEDWTHFVIRCRGDGRTYLLRFNAYEEDNMNQYTMFTYPLFTRGGPYWQITTIPFSKFFITYRGAIQDRQYRIHLNSITKVGIALQDRMTGPFQLEIDYIALGLSRRDEDEEFAYETYETPNNYSYAFGMR